MERIPFQQWWLEFLSGDDSADKSSGYGKVQFLRNWVGRRLPEEQAAFRSELVAVLAERAEGWPYAIDVLDDSASDVDRRALWCRIADRLFEGPEDWMIDVLRVLGKERDGPGYEAVRHFLLIRDIQPRWSSVAWTCWPSDPALFTDAWTRYLRTVPAASWTGGFGTEQRFLRHADALAVLKTRLKREHRTIWALLRDDLREDKAPWLTRAQREALDSVLAS